MKKKHLKNLKISDSVICTTNSLDYFTKGCSYTVIEFDHSNDPIVEDDDNDHSDDVACELESFTLSCKKTCSIKSLTPLQLALSRPITVVCYNSSGNDVTTKHYKKIKKAERYRNTYLGDAANIGHTVIITDQSGDSFTTAVPIIALKRK